MCYASSWVWLLETTRDCKENTDRIRFALYLGPVGSMKEIDWKVGSENKQAKNGKQNSKIMIVESRDD